ncbi:tripartite tricarboxylate transporter TctB family protein [Tropicimonas sp. IMCC34011]|uniref:tripartite tricarboxylate transporter TctB family protein n=1 Tax=Tropicimonas sp. IMCC34011 TaxID=2248759 RepID=UPI000E2434AA|nr:tripartite tricarboxylate transporter TctB family protein [Tropicimonas sp. IMCC34011]
MRIADRLFGPLLTAFGLAVLWGAAQLPRVPGVRFGGELMPTIYGIALIVFGGIIFLTGLREGGPAFDADEWRGRGRAGLAAAWSLAGLLLGMVLFEPLGFPLFGLLFVAVMMGLMGARPLTILIVAPVFVLTLYLTFSGVLRVSLPAGPLGAILP